MNQNRRWTKQDDEYLRKATEEGETASEISEKLNRSAGSISQRRVKLGIKMGIFKPWTAKEEKKLKDMFMSGLDDEEIAEKLNRTLSAVTTRRLMMDLKRNNSTTWTEEEDYKLEKLNSEGKSDSEIARVLGRTRSSIANRRWRLRVNGRGKVNRAASGNGLDLEIEPLKKGKNYLIKTTGTGILRKQEEEKKIVTYKGSTDHLLVFKCNNYKETYMKVDVALGEINIREATKTDYQTLQN